MVSQWYCCPYFKPHNILIIASVPINSSKVFKAGGVPRNWVTSQARPSVDPLCDKPRGLIGDLYDTPQTGMFCEWMLLVRFLSLPPQTLQACCSLLSPINSILSNIFLGDFGSKPSGNYAPSKQKSISTQS